MPALIWRSISQSHISQTNTGPTLSRRRAPHTGQVLLVHAGLTLMIGTPARAALYSICRWISERGQRPGREPPVHATGSTSRAVEREIFEDNRRLALLGELHESLRDEMQPLTNAIPLSASLPVQQAAHDPPVPRLFCREPPPSSEVRFLDSPNATKWKARRDRGLIGGHDSVQRILVRVEGDRRLRLIRLRRLPPDDEDDFPWDHGKRAKGPRRIAQERAMPLGKGKVELHALGSTDRDAEASRLAVEPI